MSRMARSKPVPLATACRSAARAFGPDSTVVVRRPQYRAAASGSAGWSRCRPPRARAGPRGARTGRGRGRVRGPSLEAHGEPEGAAAAGAADDVDLAPHQGDEPLRDGEAEAGAAVAAAGRAVRLDEGLEEARLQLGFDADAVSRTSKWTTTASPAGSSRVTRSTTSPVSVNLTALPDEVGEDLAQPPGVALQRVRDVVADEAQQLEPLGLRGLGEGAEHLADRAPQVELDVLEVDATPLRSSRSRGCR